MSIPVIILPWGESISPLWASILSTMAVLLRATRKPKKTDTPMSAVTR